MPGAPPSSDTTGLRSSFPRRSQSAVSSPAIARFTYEPGNLCSFSSIRSSSGPMSPVSAPSACGATCRCRTEALMSELYVESCPHPCEPSSAVTRTKPMYRVVKLSMRIIRSSRASAEEDDIAQRCSRFDAGHGVVDPLERIPARDQFIELQRSRLVQRDQIRDVLVDAGTTHLRAEDTDVVRRDPPGIQFNGDPRWWNADEHDG